MLKFIGLQDTTPVACLPEEKFAKVSGDDWKTEESTVARKPPVHPDVRRAFGAMLSLLKPPVAAPRVAAKAVKGKGKTIRAKTKTRGGMSLVDYRVRDAYEDGRKAWRFIKEYLNIETKMFDSVNTGTATTYAGRVDNLTNIAEGSDYNNRSGNSILIQKVQIRGQVWGNTTSGQVLQPPVLRFLVIRDMLQSSGVDPTPANVFETISDALAPFSQHLHIHDGNAAARRFRVLHDQTVAINPKFATTVAATGTGTVDLLGLDNHVFDLELKVNAHCTFQGTTGADASDYVGALYLVSISNIQTNGPYLLWRSRVFFTDN